MPRDPTYAFVDGGYLRQVGEKRGIPYVNPTHFANCAFEKMGYVRTSESLLERIYFYDAIQDEEAEVDENQRKYWEKIELLPHTHLGFGSLRGKAKKKPPRQKGVDTLLAVNMLVGAFNRIYSIALLISGDADFVPVVHEVLRLGIKVVVVGERESVADELIRAADRFIGIERFEAKNLLKSISFD